VQRIFLTLAILSTLLTAAAFGLGLSIGDPTVRETGVQKLVSYHLLTGLSALLFTTLVHAMVLTYFMGTGRWLEETTQAYRLQDRWYAESKQLKYRTILLQTLCLLLLILTGALGAIADPATRLDFQSASLIHQLVAVSTWGVNLCVHFYQYHVLARNSTLVQEVLGEVRRIRLEHGLSV